LHAALQRPGRPACLHPVTGARSGPAPALFSRAAATRAGRTVALARPQRMFAQERETVLDGVAGDVIGARAVLVRDRPAAEVVAVVKVFSGSSTVESTIGGGPGHNAHFRALLNVRRRGSGRGARRPEQPGRVCDRRHAAHGPAARVPGHPLLLAGAVRVPALHARPAQGLPEGPGGCATPGRGSCRAWRARAGLDRGARSRLRARVRSAPCNMRACPAGWTGAPRSPSRALSTAAGALTFPRASSLPGAPSPRAPRAAGGSAPVDAWLGMRGSGGALTRRRGRAGLLGEGAVQVLHSTDDFRTDPILAAVGALQFEVVQARPTLSGGAGRLGRAS